MDNSCGMGKVSLTSMRQSLATDLSLIPLPSRPTRQDVSDEAAGPADVRRVAAPGWLPDEVLKDPKTVSPVQLNSLRMKSMPTIISFTSGWGGRHGIQFRARTKQFCKESCTPVRMHQHP